MKGAHLDKRIALFALFSLPLILIAVISLIINSQPIYTGSKADEVKQEQAISPTPSLPKPISCLVPKSDTKDSVTFFIEKGATFVPTLPLQIFAVQEGVIDYLSLVEKIPTDSVTPVTTVQKNLISGGRRAWFVAVQGDITGYKDTGSDLWARIQSTARGCQTLILQNTSF